MIFTQFQQCHVRVSYYIHVYMYTLVWYVCPYVYTLYMLCMHLCTYACLCICIQVGCKAYRIWWNSFKQGEVKEDPEVWVACLDSAIPTQTLWIMNITVMVFIRYWDVIFSFLSSRRHTIFIVINHENLTIEPSLLLLLFPYCLLSFSFFIVWFSVSLPLHFSFLSLATSHSVPAWFSVFLSSASPSSDFQFFQYLDLSPLLWYKLCYKLAML